MKKLLFVIMSMFILSCGKDDGETSNLSASDYHSIESLKISNSSKKISWKTSWNFALADVLSSPDLSRVFDQEIYESDLNLLGCTNYNQLSSIEKKIFLIIFLSAISEAESDFEYDNETYNRADSTLNIGLLQIDVASAKRHSGVKYSVYKDSDLKNPVINLKVGAHILKNQLVISKYKGRLFPPRTYYWQVLTENKKRILKNINLNRKNIVFCSI